MSGCFAEMRVQTGYNLKHKKHKRDTLDRPKPKQNAIILLNETNHHKTSYSLSDALNDNLKCQFSAPKT